PGADDISVEEEGKRLFKSLKLLNKEIPDAVCSVDTFRSSIAREAVLGCGASIINDISGGEADGDMFATVAELNVPYIMMHMRGNPRTMQQFLQYDDVVADIIRWFGPKIYALHTLGVKDIILDPGFGFSKSPDQNFEMLRRFNEFSVTGLPLLAGLSRKSTIWKTLGTSAEEALNGTTVLNTVALLNGADILRVHDVKEAVEAIKLVSRLKKV
ncbi:MAG TPA: dihydropteroate synthase, partial [Bacteroidales bacterium]|nr:dihydropteroate synthase [Bacteroidales bacterium]